MEIAVIGIDHNKAHINIREKASFATYSSREKVMDELAAKGVEEIVILSTCNRSEIYISSEDVDRFIPYVVDIYRKATGLMDIEKFLTVMREDVAARHLYRVAVGFESLVLGEDQILGQVKEAMEHSIKKKYSKKILNKLFRCAITYSKAVKTKFKISENPLSISYIGLKKLKNEVESFENKTVLIVGAGNIGTLALKYMLEERPKKILMTNRTHNRLKAIVQETHHIVPIPYEKRYQYLAESDIVISATASPHKIFTKENMPDIKKKLCILDLALPRDVEKEVGDILGVKIFNIDDLKKVEEESKGYRQKILKAAMAEMKNEIEEFICWKAGAKVDPLIGYIDDKCKKIRKETMSYIENNTCISEEDKVSIERFLTSQLKEKFKKPIINVKKSQSQTQLMGLKDYLSLMAEGYGE
ncbi:glutamyl-tRNA reductase [Alkalibacter saccharofermentans]|uniref:Glutamyl-tRNA reductase n=1 Tax=Alkalibacter saccharofermentans DSM 14828 TaxID=1120975 RepID=A0A1M4SI95_9FIRM|nr:glutamyl-tRNA reductase [Alkalibacter saccharofermentans]SHE31909.1 glutamyl-tRNA reductase [Alkalibacter saccharofermentans DSM 14828]